jgi:DNA repair exonuclease SbcCD ATPase subunit
MAREIELPKGWLLADVRKAASRLGLSSEAEMKDDIETLRVFIDSREEGSCTYSDDDAVDAAGALERLATERDSLQGRVGTLQKALDDHFAADKKAAKAIFTATGRKWGFPDTVEIVAFYVAEVERLEKERDQALARYDGVILEKRDLQREYVTSANDRDSLRANLDRAKEALEQIKKDNWTEHYGLTSECGSSWSQGHWSKIAEAALAELSADAPAQHAQDLAAMQEAMKEAERALEPLAAMERGWVLHPDYVAAAIAAISKLRSVMK